MVSPADAVQGGEAMSTVVTFVFYAVLFCEGWAFGSRMGAASNRGRSGWFLLAAFVVHSLCILPIASLFFRLRDTIF